MYRNSNQEFDENVYEFLFLDAVFSFVALVASLIVLMVSIEKMNAYKNGNLNNYKQRELGRVSEIVLILLLIASLYFAYTTYRNYKKNPTSDNKNFFIAAILALIAVIIRFIEVFKSNGSDVVGAEDVL